MALRFAPSLVAVLPPWRFGQGWHGIEDRNGKIRSVGEAEVKPTAKEPIVVVPLQMERSEWRANLVFDAQGRLTTVRFAPATMAPATPLAADWRAPAYVNPKKFRDVDVRVGFSPWVLVGALSLPAGKGPFPAVVLVHGSGPNDQDETVGAVKPFRDLAWGLASQGIAVLRYEKRTRTYGEKMSKLPVTVKEEVIDDAVAAVDFLRDNDAIDKKRIVVLGHSLGGALAPRIAAATKGKVAGVVVMAGPTRPSRTSSRSRSRTSSRPARPPRRRSPRCARTRRRSAPSTRRSRPRGSSSTLRRATGSTSPPTTPARRPARTRCPSWSCRATATTWSRRRTWRAGRRRSTERRSRSSRPSPTPTTSS